MKEITRILTAIDRGEPHAAEPLLPLVYDELRKLAAQRWAQEMPGQTLQATAVVHEAYVRLVDVDQAQRWNNRGHYFAAAAEAMRRILIENARRKIALKRGGDRQRLDLELAEPAAPRLSNAGACFILTPDSRVYSSTGRQPATKSRKARRHRRSAAAPGSASSFSGTEAPSPTPRSPRARWPPHRLHAPG